MLLAVGGEDPVPWPGTQAPDDAELNEQIEDALGLNELERAEEYLEAWEKGEDAEHIFVQQEWIDDGFWDLDRLFQFGDALFGHEFRADDGYGHEGKPVPMQRVHEGRRGGLDTFSCAGCHFVGGADGAGTIAQNALLLGDGEHLDSAVVRNPPAVIGLGPVQALATEMTTDLQLLRDGAVMAADESGQAQTVQMLSKGVEFGRLTVSAEGQLDTSELEGVDADLVVKPFGWKGNIPNLRRAVEDAARVHFGIQSHVLALEHQANPDPEALGRGPDWFDPDEDGRARELEEGILTAAAVYLAMLESPQIIPPHDPGLRDRWANGSALFDEIGCNDCHRRELPMLNAIWREYSDTTEGPPVEFNLLSDGEHPKSGNRVQLFSDLKRHDMGPELADPFEVSQDSIPAGVFLTRPLWGLAESPPYLHDGRAATIPEAIAAHGGEAEASRDAFTALSIDDRADLHVFLLSLSRVPRLRVPQ
ncbi:MAG: di-heme oxidoredictase family protein [Myxococcota bacterium]